MNKEAIRDILGHLVVKGKCVDCGKVYIGNSSDLEEAAESLHHTGWREFRYNLYCQNCIDRVKRGK